ncbi:MAG: serine hydrolase [Ruminococcaceae bacterium]|nr:serine hydrolase [Oscillospiraceae bacterium]
MKKADRILEAVKNEKQGYTGQLGFAFYDLNTGEDCYLEGDQAIPTASVFKIYLLTELFRQAEAGLISLDDCIEVTPETVSPGSGILYRFHHNVALSVHDHAVLMMALSDNTATDKLFALIGRDNILENVIRPLGLQKTKVDFDCTKLIWNFYHDPETGERINSYNNPWFRCETEQSDCSSPRDMVTILQALHDATLLSREASEQVLALMDPIPKKARLAKYLPKGVRVARKTGSLTNCLCNDAGVVYTPKGDYVIVTFYNGNVGTKEEWEKDGSAGAAEEFLARISKAVYDIYMED